MLEKHIQFHQYVIPSVDTNLTILPFTVHSTYTQESLFCLKSDKFHITVFEPKPYMNKCKPEPSINYRDVTVKIL